MNTKRANLSELVGKTLAAVENMEPGGDPVRFLCTDGTVYQLAYYQDCCASCELIDVVGDPEDLIGHPILKAEESNGDAPAPDGMGDDSETWTFYSFRTVKGSVDLRWFGSSNGYYSEEATFEQVVD